MGPRPVIFVSAVTAELRSARDLVAKTLLRLGYDAHWEDLFGTGQGDLPQLLRGKIKDAAGFIQLVGHRYGTDLSAPHPQAGRASYTQLEAHFARELKKDAWYFLLSPDYPTDTPAPEPEEFRQLQLAYRQRLGSGPRLYHGIANPDALRAAILELRDDLTHLRSGWKKWSALVLGLLTLCAGLGIWAARQQHEIGQKQTHTQHGIAEVKSAVADLTKYVADPVNLRRKLEEKIEQSFQEKRAALLAADAPYSQMDELIRWHDQARSQVTGAVAFIVARAGDPKSTIVHQAALILEEQGVDAALDFLDRTLRAEGQRHKDAGRQFAEASLLKAGLHESRLETAAQERALRDATAFAPDWWYPHLELGSLLYGQAQWAAAEREYEAARQTMSPEAEATVINNFAQLYRATNRFAEAEPLYERAVKLDENRLGPDHPDVARDLNNLAQLYQDTSRLAAAEPLMERALKINETSYGPDHPKVAMGLNNLAQLYQATNRLAAAEPLLERALKIDETNLGPEHLKVAIRLNNLATLYQVTDRLPAAEPLMERALKIIEKSFGPEHPNVATLLNNLAQLYQNTARPAQAEPLMKRALAILEKSLGPEHPKVALSLNNLAVLYSSTQRMAEAEAAMRRMVVIFLKFTKETGHPHENLRVAMDNYVQLLEKRKVRKSEREKRLLEAGREAGFSAKAFAELFKRLEE